MQRFRLRAAAILIGIFLPALGVCASLSAPLAWSLFCMADPSGGNFCCGDESGSSCPAPDRAPTSPRCRACEGLLNFSSEERPALRLLEAAPPLPATLAAAGPTPTLFSPNRIQSLSASPPLHLLHESFRN